MAKVKIDNVEFDTTNFSEKANSILSSLNTINKQIKEKNNMRAILTKAKNAYVAELKSEIISYKAGTNFDD